MSNESLYASFIMNNGTLIKPGSIAQYIAEFRTSIPQNTVSGSFILSTGGLAYGPLQWTPPNMTSTSSKHYYVVFTFSFDSNSACCNRTMWFSGPQGNITDWIPGYLPDVLSSALSGHFSDAIIEVDTPGNYTLHYLNQQTSANVTGRVALGTSSVVFSKPNLQVGAITIGAITIAIAAAFGSVTGLVS